jgi:hypothetical protein
MCKLGFFWHSWAFKKAQFTHERVETTFFCSMSPLKAPNRLKSLKLVRRLITYNVHYSLQLKFQ